LPIYANNNKIENNYPQASNKHTKYVAAIPEEGTIEKKANEMGSSSINTPTVFEAGIEDRFEDIRKKSVLISPSIYILIRKS
jgi:hypothetical protein